VTDDEHGEHVFVPYHPDWFMPRCKVCREFEEHELHRLDDGEETTVEPR
jgi:hypothetical protein